MQLNVEAMFAPLRSGAHAALVSASFLPLRSQPWELSCLLLPFLFLPMTEDPPWVHGTETKFLVSKNSQTYQPHIIE